MGAPSTAQLDQALVAYGQCLGERLDVVLRFRADRFAGILDELSLRPGDSDTSLVERERTRCAELVGLDAIVTAAQADSPLTPQQERDIALEYSECVSARLPEAAGAIASTPLDGLDDVNASYNELIVTVTDLDTLNDCRDGAMFGEALRFGDSASPN